MLFLILNLSIFCGADGAVDPNGNSMYIVHQGSVKAVTVKNGQELMLGLIDQGKFFGEIGLMIDMPRTAQIRACEKSLLLEIRKADFQNFLAVANTPALRKNLDDLLKRRTAEHFRKYNVS
jgi:CRP-like cAMP-binding protein